MKLNGEISTVRIHVAIGLISAAIIAFQLVLMQILSYIQWYHFAYMIISIALLGFGAAGTFLTLFRENLRQNYNRLFPLLLFITAILMPLVVLVANAEPVRFDSLLIFHDLRYADRLIATYFIFFLPFFTGALAIGMSFLKFSGKIGKIYFSNLIGSGIGGIIALLLMQFFLPEQLPVPGSRYCPFGWICRFSEKCREITPIYCPGFSCCLADRVFYSREIKTFGVQRYQ